MPIALIIISTINLKKEIKSEKRLSKCIEKPLKIVNQNNIKLCKDIARKEILKIVKRLLNKKKKIKLK